MALPFEGLDRLADIQQLRESAQRPAQVQQMQMPSPDAGLQSLGQQEVDVATGIPVGFNPSDAMGQVMNTAGQYAMANPQKTGPFAAALAAFGAGSEAANMIDKRVSKESEREDLSAVRDMAQGLPDRTRTVMPTTTMQQNIPFEIQEEVQVSEVAPQAKLASLMPMQAGGRPDIPDIQGIKNKTEFQNQLNSVIADQTIDPAVKRLLPFWTREEGFLTTTKSAIEDGTTKDIGFGHKLTNQERKSKRVYGIDISKPLSTENALKIAVKDLEGGLKQIQNNITKMKKNKLLPKNVQSYDQLNTDQKAALLDIQKNVKKGIVNYPKFTKAVLTGDSNLANEEHERFFVKDGKFVLMEKRNKEFVKEFPSIFMSKENKTRDDLQELASLEQTTIKTPTKKESKDTGFLESAKEVGSGLLNLLGRDHTVKKGDTLYAIAKESGVSVEDLLKSNPNIVDRDKISIGQEVDIPNFKSFVNKFKDAFGLKEGGDVGKYFEGQVEGEGDGMSDEITFRVEGGNPDYALLSKDEYVLPADVVSMLGNGSSDAGSDELDQFVKDTRKQAFGREEQQTQIDAEEGLSSLV